MDQRSPSSSFVGSSESRNVEPMNITDAILSYVNQNQHTQDPTTLLNNIQEMVKWHKAKEQQQTAPPPSASSYMQPTHHEMRPQHPLSSLASFNQQHGLPTSNHSINTQNRQQPHVGNHFSAPTCSSSSTLPTPSNNTFPSSTTTTTSNNEDETFTLYIKPARKTAKYFITAIPPKLYCSPYKYDLMLRIPVEINEQCDFIFTLLDSESRERVAKNNKGDEAYCVERTKTQRKNHLKPGFVNATFRLNFSICSFHNNRKPFVMTVHTRNKNLNRNVNNTGGDCVEDRLVLISDPFSIFARKSGVKDDDWGLEFGIEPESTPPKKEKKSVPKRKRSQSEASSSSNSSEEYQEQQEDASSKKKKNKASVEVIKSENTMNSVNTNSSSDVRMNDRTSVVESEFQILENEDTQDHLENINAQLNNEDWSKLFDFSASSPNSLFPFIQEEVVHCQSQLQPQYSGLQQLEQTFGMPSNAQIQPPVDLTLMLYQELLKQQSHKGGYPQLFLNNIPSQQTEMSLAVQGAVNQMMWQQPQQTLQNTTVENLDLSRILLAKSSSRPNLQQPQIQQPQQRQDSQENGNLLLSLDESLYSKLFGNNYNSTNYFFE